MKKVLIASGAVAVVVIGLVVSTSFRTDEVEPEKVALPRAVGEAGARSTSQTDGDGSLPTPAAPLRFSLPHHAAGRPHPPVAGTIERVSPTPPSEPGKAGCTLK